MYVGKQEYNFCLWCQPPHLHLDSRVRTKLKPTTGHDPETVPSNSYFMILLNVIHHLHHSFPHQNSVHMPCLPIPASRIPLHPPSEKHWLGM